MGLRAAVIEKLPHQLLLYQRPRRTSEPARHTFADSGARTVWLAHNISVKMAGKALDPVIDGMGGTRDPGQYRSPLA